MISDSSFKTLTPNLTEDKDWKWINEAPKHCDQQGFFYDDEKEEKD